MPKGHFMNDMHRSDPALASHGGKLDRLIEQNDRIIELLERQQGAQPEADRDASTDEPKALAPPAPPEDPPTPQPQQDIARREMEEQERLTQPSIFDDVDRPSSGDTSPETRNANTAAEKGLENAHHDVTFERDVHSKN